jgi:hypothetical protein
MPPTVKQVREAMNSDPNKYSAWWTDGERAAWYRAHNAWTLHLNPRKLDAQKRVARRNNENLIRRLQGRSRHYTATRIDTTGSSPTITATYPTKIAVEDAVAKDRYHFPDRFTYLIDIEKASKGRGIRLRHDPME